MSNQKLVIVLCMDSHIRKYLQLRQTITFTNANISLPMKYAMTCSQQLNGKAVAIRC